MINFMDFPSEERMEERLNEIARKLAKVLRVQDWDIKVHIINAYEMDKKYGDCTYMGISDRNANLNTADIYINKDSCEDWYLTLVHELIHVQQTALIHCTKAYFQEEHSYWNELLEQLTERQAKAFSQIYPVERLEIDT